MNPGGNCLVRVDNFGEKNFFRTEGKRNNKGHLVLSGHKPEMKRTNKNLK